MALTWKLYIELPVDQRKTLPEQLHHCMREKAAMKIQRWIRGHKALKVPRLQKRIKSKESISKVDLAYLIVHHPRGFHNTYHTEHVFFKFHRFFHDHDVKMSEDKIHQFFSYFTRAVDGSAHRLFDLMECLCTKPHLIQLNEKVVLKVLCLFSKQVLQDIFSRMHTIKDAS